MKTLSTHPIFGLKHALYDTGGKKDYMFDDDTPQGAEELARPGFVYTIPYQYKFGAKEWQGDLGLNMYDYGWRNYDAALGRWMNIDPLAFVTKPISPYAAMVNNPVFFMDPDGMKAADVIITGNRSEQAVKELQKSVNGELKISRDNKTGKVTATPIEGKTLSAKSQKLLDATTDNSIKVQVLATDDKKTPSNAVNVGVFVSAEVSPTREVDGKKAVTTKQAINPDILNTMDNYFGDPGATTLHEVIESYIAGQMVQESGVSSGNSLTADSIYEDAHAAATEIAPQSIDGAETNKAIPYVDNNGNVQKIVIKKDGKNAKTIWSQ